MHGLQLGTRVSVWSDEEGMWLNGTVSELNIDSGVLSARHAVGKSLCCCPSNCSTRVTAGEFLVDYDDEADGQGWTALSQSWKHLSPHLQGSSADNEAYDRTADEVLDTAVLRQSEPATGATECSPAAPAASAVPAVPEVPVAPAATSPAQQSAPDSDPQVLDLLRELYQETVRCDG